MIESYSQKEIEEKIDQYVNGQLSDVEVEQLWAELIQDEYYLDYLKSAANLKAVIEKRNSKAKVTRMRRYTSYAAAAVITLVIGVLTVLNYPGVDFSSDVQPIDKIELDYYRSAESAVDASGDSRVIRDAITLANTGRFNEAVALLEKELSQTDDPEWMAELNLNLGSLFYNEGRFQESITYYQKVLDQKEQIDVLTLEKTYWYLGNAYFQTDQLDKARDTIEKAYELNGAYRRVAQSYLNALSR